MRPRFRFFYALAAAIVTYGALNAFNTPRMAGPGWGHHGWGGHHHGWQAGSCGHGCAPAQENATSQEAQ